MHFQWRTGLKVVYIAFLPNEQQWLLTHNVHKGGKNGRGGKTLKSKCEHDRRLDGWSGPKFGYA